MRDKINDHARELVFSSKQTDLWRSLMQVLLAFLPFQQFLHYISLKDHAHIITSIANSCDSFALREPFKIPDNISFLCRTAPANAKAWCKHRHFKEFESNFW